MELRKIDSAANKKIKLVSSLKQRKYRDREGLFFVEGVRLSEMAADSGWEIPFGLYTGGLRREGRGMALLERLGGRGCLLYEVSEEIFAKASATETPQGILLVMRQKRNSLERFVFRESSLWMILDGIQDPGNAGTMIRTADAAGLDGVILLEGSVDVFGDKTVRATMGSLFHLSIYTEVRRERFLEFARERNLTLYAAALDPTAQAYHRTDFTGNVAVIFGNEANGVSKELLDAAHKLYIPMYGKAESLNAASAAAIVIYEAIRQRKDR